ncbi:hypothetical protein PybrP1_005870 [[Pythium] brassicae (nom. inval.)]|nr:hypothetical protein PybrP1_005870 [[Pythium] brassicae (nom. inval.)]
MVVAAMFTPVHRSWDAFEQSLKEYTQKTYQLYVVRTTTSVKRRNLRITENASSSSSSSSFLSAAAGSALAAGDAHGGSQHESDGEAAVGGAGDTAGSSERGPPPLPLHLQQQLIPENFKWYSKTLTCTHGWKDRHRGSGKRALSVARSTSCPAKMCVTLQHHGRGDDGWQVVLTRHVRAHNHQLSKELYLNYQENRRIYDPDLLLVATGGNAPHRRDPQLSRGRLSHLLVDADGQHSPAFVGYAHPSALTDEHSGTASGDLTGHADSPTGSVATAHSVTRAPGVSQKSHASWEHFHRYVTEYAAQSKQSFRARSTVSAAAKNLKAKAVASKLGRPDASVDEVLIPATARWYSKMLICSHGWKRKSRSKALRARGDIAAGSEASCPALLMARLQRTADGDWHVVVNRQVVEHNHPLGDNSSSTSTGASGNDAAVSSAFDMHRPGATASGSEPVASSHHSVLQYFGTDDTGALSDSAGHELDAGNDDADDEAGDDEADAPAPAASAPPAQQAWVVVAQPFETVHRSWDEFHARLQEYSDRSFQLYRIRTTSSVDGRNLKIPDVQLQPARNARGRKSDGRAIPSEWKWYSKTLTCTHGWKERRRGTGKRTVQIFRSTACPVKICATVQFVEAAEPEEAGGSSGEAERGKWCVVVTKHVLEHNHNLSKELHQHYCENRRIYDPDLLRIDSSNEHAVRKPKKHHHSVLLGSEDGALAPHGVGSGAGAASDDSFPSTASAPSIMFPTATGTQQPPASYLYQAHQYFAVDQADASLSFASPSFTSASLALSSSANAAGGGGSGTSAESPFAPPTLQAASDASDRLRAAVAAPSASEGDAAGEDAGASGSGVVWTPALEPEIVTLASGGGATFWRAPRVQRHHASWEAFQAHLDAYSDATFQLFRVRTTSSISARNARIMQQGADRREIPTPVGEAAPDSASAVSLVPESFQWYSKTFVCTHGWKERRRGNGQRVSHSLRSTACPAKLCVTLQRVVQEADRWHVVVTKQGTDHNHELSVHAYQQYSEVRRIKDPTLLDRAEALWTKGQSRRKIFEFLKQHAPNAIVMKDVHNLVQRWQQQHGGKPRGSSSRAVLTDEGSDAAMPNRGGGADGGEELETTGSPFEHAQHEEEEEI